MPICSRTLRIWPQSDQFLGAPVGASTSEFDLKRRDIPPQFTARDIEHARTLLSEYRQAANPTALASIAVCLAGPLLLSGSDFLVAHSDLRLPLYGVMLAACLNGGAILISRHRAMQARRTLSACKADDGD